MVEVPAQTENTKELLLYWIKERYEVFLRRKNGAGRPWSHDPVFQRTYFCNVHRENDRVTRWIRDFYNPHAGERNFDYNVVFSRFINWPETLGAVGYLQTHSPKDLERVLVDLSGGGRKIWGGAYVITTHGMPMAKVHYLTHYVLEQTHRQLEPLKAQRTCAGMARTLQVIEGIGSFLSGQIVADMKNTPGHALYSAPDSETFVVPGPGSVRGASWFHFGSEKGVTLSNFDRYFPTIREWVDAWVFATEIPPIDNQDLQNCLCEFDKYMRVRNGTGRSKRGYPGI
jgi:hypothetical protein